MEPKSELDTIVEYFTDAWSNKRNKIVLLIVFIVGVLGIGNCGLWEGLWFSGQEWNEHLMSVNTIALSVAIPVLIEIVLFEEKKPIKGLAIFVGFVVIIAHIVSICCRRNSLISWLTAIVVWLIAHITWLIVKSQNQTCKNKEETKINSQSRFDNTTNVSQRRELFSHNVTVKIKFATENPKKGKGNEAE